MDESTRDVPAHHLARNTDRLRISPNLAERKKTVDAAQDRGTSPNGGDDLRQRGDEMVLLLRSRTHHGQEGCCQFWDETPAMVTCLLFMDGFHSHEKTGERGTQKIAPPQRNPRNSNRFLPKLTVDACLCLVRLGNYFVLSPAPMDHQKSKETVLWPE